MKPLTKILLLASLIVLNAAAATSDKPNVIFILADDLGWADTTLYGHTTLYQTPNLERLAKRGMVFSRAYSASPLCSPTRSSILTGQTPARTGFTAPNGHSGKAVLHATVQEKGGAGNETLQTESITRLDTNFPTLGKRFKQAGYATAHFGKWHLGPEPYSPLQHGFDVDIPHWPRPGPAGSFVAPWKFKDFDADPGEPHQHIEDRMAEKAVKWMGSLPKGQPFYMNYWMFSVHAPFDAKAALIEKYRRKIDPKNAQHSPTYAAMVKSMDDAIGALLDAADKAGLADQTIFIFTADSDGNMYNGIREKDREGKEFVVEPTSNRPLRGGKLLPRGIFTFFPHSPPVPDWLPPAMCLHSGDWKLIRLFHQGVNGAHGYRLYNLKADLGEAHDLAKAQPDKVRELDRLIQDHIEQSKAVVPRPNPAFDPAQYRPERVGQQPGGLKVGGDENPKAAKKGKKANKSN